MAERRDLEVPVVTVRGGPPERLADPRTGTGLRGVGLVLAVAAVVLAVVQGRHEERALPRARVPLDAELRLVGRAVSVSQGGVLVVPVVLQDLGSGLTVTSARAYAEPVREDPITDPPDEVAPGDAQRFVVLLSPDCRLLTSRSDLQFRASLLVRVQQEQVVRSLVLDIGSDRALSEVVDGLCGRD